MIWPIAMRAAVPCTLPYAPHMPVWRRSAPALRNILLMRRQWKGCMADAEVELILARVLHHVLVRGNAAMPPSLGEICSFSKLQERKESGRGETWWAHVSERAAAAETHAAQGDPHPARAGSMACDAATPTRGRPARARDARVGRARRARIRRATPHDCRLPRRGSWTLARSAPRAQRRRASRRENLTRNPRKTRWRTVPETVGRGAIRTRRGRRATASRAPLAMRGFASMHERGRERT